jgi:hypothetical protein
MKTVKWRNFKTSKNSIIKKMSYNELFYMKTPFN